MIPIDAVVGGNYSVLKVALIRYVLQLPQFQGIKSFN